MPIIYDKEWSISSVWYYTAATDTFTELNASDFDVLKAGAAIGDYLLFLNEGISNNSIIKPYNFHNLHFNISQAVIADNITLEWEYFGLSDAASYFPEWLAIEGLVDNTDSFKNSGALSVIFPLPKWFFMRRGEFSLTYIYVNGVLKRASCVRARITELTNVINVGHVSDTVLINDDCIRVQNEIVDYEAIYQADALNGWGKVTKLGNSYKFISGLILESSQLLDKNINAQHGDEDFKGRFSGDLWSTFRLGEKVNGIGVNGGRIYITTGENSNYNNFYGTFILYGSILEKTWGRYSDLGFYGNTEILDSSLISENDFFFFNYPDKTLKRTVLHFNYSNSWLYLYVNAEIDRLALGDGYGCLGYTLNLSNIDFLGTKKVNAIFSANLYDCINIPPSNFDVQQSSKNIWSTINYTLGLKVTTEGGVGIFGASVTIEAPSSIYSILTGGDGTVSQVVKVYDTLYFTGQSRIENFYNPYTITVTKEGYQDYTLVLEISKPESLVISLKPTPSPLTFSITRLLSRIFSSGMAITSQELITEGAVEHEASLDEEAIITNSARATYRPDSEDILIEQQVDGSWEDAEIICEGAEIQRGSASVVDDPDPVYIDQHISGSIQSSNLSAKIVSTSNVKGEIL
jgi:hypothetical protein